MPFAFNAVKLYVVTTNEKLWTRAKEACMALEYKKDRTRDVLKKHVSIGNKQHKHELEGRPVAARPLECLKKSQPNDYYINEEGIYELVFGSQQPKAKALESIVLMCCFLIFDHKQNEGRALTSNRRKR